MILQKQSRAVLVAFFIRIYRSLQKIDHSLHWGKQSVNSSR